MEETDFNHTILEVFYEEAVELMKEFVDSNNKLELDPSNIQYFNESKRIIHTLKGSARMLKFNHMAEFCHMIEDFSLNRKKNNGFDLGYFNVMRESYAYFADSISAIIQHTDLAPPVGLCEKLRSADARSQPSPVMSAEIEKHEKKIDDFVYNSDKIRLSVETITKLSKLTSASRLARVHIKQQKDMMIYYYEMLMEKLKLLKNNVKDLHGQTEITSFKQENSRSEFDLLQFDQYSDLQRQAKNINEITNDLFNISHHIAEVIDLQEGHLIDQKRVISELEGNLTNVRMISFYYLVPRLKEIVSQIGKELKKKVRLEIEGDSCDMDRSVLENLIIPLSHILRNSIDHGIEFPSQRVLKNKKEEGTITLSFSRKSSVVIVTIQDDGAGLDEKKILTKAMNLGLVTEERELSEAELSTYVMMPGFSTSEVVTQISGRGMGMDIVNMEIKKLGGRISIQSVQDKGIKFTIQLPFTLSLNKTLIFQVGFQLFGIFMVHVSGVTRILGSEIKEKIENNQSLRYADRDYDLYYLGDSLMSDFSHIHSKQVYFPVLLIEMNHYATAFVVDTIIGFREIVIKTLGRQLSSVREALGASLLGDGRIVLVLDIDALVQKKKQKSCEPVGKYVTPTIFVIDDSVTVRKVTRRLLEKNQYAVIEAKDGEEALNLMEIHVPTIILLDLEMPNMGGFEVIERIRAHPTLCHVYIIIISSRSAEMYTQKALNKGADYFMSKPFSESGLLTLLNSVTRDKLGQSGQTVQRQSVGQRPPC